MLIIMLLYLEHAKDVNFHNCSYNINIVILLNLYSVAYPEGTSNWDEWHPYSIKEYQI